jgi:hypothetical protein
MPRETVARFEIEEVQVLSADGSVDEAAFYLLEVPMDR